MGVRWEVPGLVGYCDGYLVCLSRTRPTAVEMRKIVITD